MSRTSNNYGVPQGGGGGVSYDVSVLATGQSTTTSAYGNLSYSNVSTVQHGTFENGTVNASQTGGVHSQNATGICSFTFNTSGIYVVEFASYSNSNVGGFQFVDVHRNGSTIRDEVICYVGIYAHFNRKLGTAIRQFNSGDKLTFFTRSSSDEMSGKSVVGLSIRLMLLRCNRFHFGRWSQF